MNNVADSKDIVSVINTLVNAGKIFTAYNVTLILRRSGYQTNHPSVRNEIRAYPFGGNNYKESLALNPEFSNSASGFTQVPNIYHPNNASRSEIDAFEQSVLDSVKLGMSAINPPSTPAPKVGGVVLQLNKTPHKSHIVGTSAHVKTKPVPTPKKLTGEELDIKPDMRGRYTIPSRIVKEYFTVGDLIGITHDSANGTTLFEKYDPNVTYTTKLTVDSHNNLRVKDGHLSYSNGKMVVEYIKAKSQFLLKEV